MSSGCSLIALPLIKDCPKPPEVIMREPRMMATLPEGELSFEVMANTMGQNFKACHDNSDQLRACQKWAKEVTK